MTKTNTRSRIVSILLVLMMLLTMVPITGVTASAAEPEWTTVNTYEEWKAAMQQSGETYIKLGDNIAASGMNGGYGLGSADGVRVNGNIHLDLNGKKLTLKKSQIEAGGEICFIRVITGSLTIEDSGNGGEIVGVNKVTKRYMQLIEVQDGTKLTLNSGKLHLEINADTSTPNATIRFGGTVEINGGTVSISKMGEWDEPTAYIYRQNFALEAIEGSFRSCALINGGTFDGRVLLAAKAKASGVADNVITGGDFKKSIYIRKDKAVTGDVPLNVSIQGGTYHYTPGYRTNPADHLYYPGKKNSDPFDLFQFATLGFRDSEGYYDDVVYDAFKGGSLYEPDKYDMDAFASMFPKNVIITAEGQEYDHYDQREDEPRHIIVNDAAFTGSSSALDLAHLVNSHYKTITVTTIPENSLKNMTLKVGSDGTPLPAKGDSNVYGDVTLGSDGTLTKTVYITALGNKQLKEMYYSNPSKIDFGYRLNIFKDGVRVTDYTGDSLTYAALGDEISVSVQLRDFEFEEGVYTFRLALWPYLRGSEAQIGETLVGLWKLTAEKEPPAPVAHSITITNTHGTATPATAIAGETVTVKADDRTGYSQMFTQWYTKTAGVTFADVTKQETTFVMPDRDVQVYPGYQQVSFTRQPLDSWPQVNHGSKATVTFSAPITKWELKEGNTTVASSGNLFINTGNPITVDIPAQSSAVEKTYTVVVTANGQKFSSNEFKVKWVNWPQAPAVEFTPADGTQFVGEIDVTVSDALYAGEEIFEIAYTTDGTDPKTSATTIYANTDTKHITLTETTTIKARTYNHDASADAEKWGPLATATFTKYSDTTLPKPTITPEGTTYTGSIKAYLTAPALDGVKMEYCLMRTGDPDIPDRWETYDPETGITVNDFGSITLYARSFKDVDAETPDGLYYVEHLTSENATATYTRTYSAAIDNVTVSGKVGKTMTQDVVIRMNGDRFENITAGDDVSAWFNLPAGLTAKVKELSDANGYHRTLTVTISGMPTATSATAITVTIPKDKLYANNTTDLTVLSNPNAYYSIALDADHQHDYSGQPYLYLDPGNHYQECKAGDGYNIQAHEFTPWTDNENGTHSRHCTVCKMTDGSTYTETAEHTWVWVVDQEAALGQPGKQHEECTGCHAKRSENTEIPALRDYAVTVTGGTATVAAGTTITRAMEGVEVTVTAQAPGGKHFVKWVVKAGGVTLANETSATTTFIMPANDVTIEAEFAENPVEAYTLTVIKGTASVAAGTPITDKIEQNTVVTVTADAPETGKVFDKWVVLEGNVTLADATKATTTFTMPASAVKLEATYKDASPSHTHSYGTDWKYDDNNHWHECECGDKADLAAHSASEWIVDTAATETADGSKHKECTVCKKVLETAPIPATGSTHTHSYGMDWKYDDINHWHECECGDKADTAAHSFQWVIDKAATKEATGTKHEECTVCGAKRSENTVIDKLPDGGNTGNTGSGDNNTNKPGKDDSTKSPQTGDNSNLIGWLAALFVSGGVLTVLGLNGKKRKESEAE